MYIWIDFGLRLEKDDDSGDDDKDDDTSLESCLAVKRWLKFADFSLELVRFLLLCSYMARNNKTNEDNGNRSITLRRGDVFFEEANIRKDIF